MYLEIIREDITKMKVDAIVNPSNRSLLVGDLKSVSGQIYNAAGFDELNEATRIYSPIDWSVAIITPAFNLASKYVIHVANPIWFDGKHNEIELLRKSYQNIFQCVLDQKLKSVAFPLLSAGTYGWPKDQALQIALSEIQAFIMHHEIKVYLLVYDKSVFELSKKLSDSVKDYIDQHYEEEELEFLCTISNFNELDDLLKKHDISFSDQLFKYIDEKKMSEVEVYKRANVSKAVFSKIRSNKDYKPLKTTAFAFCIALKLNKKEAINLLNKAGLSFSPYSKLDIIVEYFIAKKNYDLFELNAVLYEYDQSLLGSNLN